MRVFVAGATGATGVVFTPAATAAGIELVLHVRPQSAAKLSDSRAAVLDLGDLPALSEALRGCDAVVSLVGTMRSRFQAGDTYATADVGSTRQLVAGAKEAGVPRFLLLSAFLAGFPDPYSRAKGEAEAIVRASGLAWTIFRPSVLVSPPGAASTHGRRESPAAVDAIGRGLRAVPGLRGFADDARPIPIEVLCRSMVRVLRSPRDGAVLTGRDLWEIGA
jgi:uncharacterized protein YbjT (DUF2867 family)